MNLNDFEHLALPLLSGVVGIALFLVLVARRWFARFQRGFLLAVGLAIGCVALFAVALMGSWGYEASRRILSAELSVSLSSVGDLVERQIERNVQRATEHLQGLSADAAAALSPSGDVTGIVGSLRAVLQFTPHYLALDLMDASGRVVASSAVKGANAAPDRIGTAFNLDGKTFVSEPRRSDDFKGVTVYVSVPVKSGGGEVIGALGTVIDLQSVLEDVVRTARFNQSGYMWIVGGDGRVLAHPYTKHLGEDVSHHGAVVAARSLASGEITALNLDNQLRRFVFRQVRNPQSVGGKPWLLLTAIDESEALAPLVALRKQLLAAVGLILLASVFVAWRVSKSLTRPMDEMVAMAQAVHSGDLTRRSGLQGRDAIGRLGVAMDEMTKGLQERDRVKDVFGRYIAKQAAEHLMKGPLDLGGESKRVTILFSDIRGFTSMAETMAPADVVRFLNLYFSEMVDAVMEQEGMLDKFLGDGLMAVFGSFGDQPDHARRAVLAGLRMKSLLAKINGERAISGHPPVSIGIGIHTDEVIVGSIGSKQRLEFTHIGDGVNTASRVQALNKEYHTTILITGATFDALGGEFETNAIAEVTLRGKTRSLPIYEVISSASAARV